MKSWPSGLEVDIYLMESPNAVKVRRSIIRKYRISLIVSTIVLMK